MGIIVQKFGGSSVADTERLWRVCQHIKRERNDGNLVVVVVSAQGKTTDRLIYEEAQITASPNLLEHDFLVSVRRTNYDCKTMYVFAKVRIKSHSIRWMASSNYYGQQIRRRCHKIYWKSKHYARTRKWKYCSSGWFSRSR